MSNLQNNQTFICPECGYDGGKWGQVKQLNLHNPNDWICASCNFAWKVTERRERNE